jgi:hypothetical protein
MHSRAGHAPGHHRRLRTGRDSADPPASAAGCSWIGWCEPCRSQPLLSILSRSISRRNRQNR